MWHMTHGRTGIQLPVTPEKCVMLFSVHALGLISRAGKRVQCMDIYLDVHGSLVSSIICVRLLIMSSETLIN